MNKFAFNNKVGTVSEPISLTNGGYGVFKVSEVKEAGMRPFDEVKTMMDSRVRREKKTEKMRALAEQLRQSLTQGDSLKKVTAQRPNLQVQHLSSFTFQQGFVPGVGRDMAFIGALSGLNPGEISRPIEGTRSVYLMHLLSKTAFDSTEYDKQRESLRAQLLSEKKNRFFQEWFDHLKKSVEIVDNRDVFYR